MLDYIPHVLCSMTKLAASHAGTEIKVADTDRFILVFIRKRVVSLCHCTDKDTNALLRADTLDIVVYTHHVCIKRQCHLSAIRRQVIRDWILDHFEQFFLRILGANREFV